MSERPGVRSRTKAPPCPQAIVPGPPPPPSTEARLEATLNEVIRASCAFCDWTMTGKLRDVRPAQASHARHAHGRKSHSAVLKQSANVKRNLARIERSRKRGQEAALEDASPALAVPV